MATELLTSARLELVTRYVENVCKSPGETCLSLRGASLSDQEFLEKILPVLAKSNPSKWTTVDLCWNNLTVVGIRELARLIRSAGEDSGGNIKNLHLDCNNLMDVGVGELVSGLGSEYFSKLESLTLGFNRLSDQSVQVLAKLLPKSNIKILSLDCNSLTDTGLKHLAEVLPQTQIKTLTLSFNQMTEKGVTHLADVLPSCPFLTELSLNSNNISDAGLSYLSKKLLSSSVKLQKLELCACNVTDEGVRSLVEAIKYSELDYVDLTGNNFDSEMIKEMNRIIALKKTNWFKTMNALLSTKYVPHVGRSSSIASLPKELLRKVGETLPQFPPAPPHVTPQVLVFNLFVMLDPQQQQDAGSHNAVSVS